MPLEAVRIIGVLGGMGPSATVDFLAKIVAATPATCDQEHLPVVLWSNLDEGRELTVPVALDLLDAGPISCFLDGRKYLWRYTTSRQDSRASPREAMARACVVQATAVANPLSGRTD
jgi:hypothetical protein